jgi:hypothetical protein
MREAFRVEYLLMKDTPDSVLEGDVAEVVFKKAIETVPGMYLKQMILIC